jgi:ABC-type branched-subunit amino acid transport system permease subunit
MGAGAIYTSGRLCSVTISGYWLRFATFIFMWIGLAGSLNLLTGYTGYLDFGHIAFFGVGAYVTGILMVKPGRRSSLLCWLGR